MAGITGEAETKMAERTLRERIDRELTALNRMENYSERDRKLPWYQRLLRKLMGWYVDPIRERQWGSNQKLVVILEEVCRENQALWERLVEADSRGAKQEQKQEEDTAAQRKAREEDAEERKKLAALITETGNRLEQRIVDIEKREIWTRERFEGQDVKFESLRIFEEWARKRFEGQDERFESLRIFEEWARKRFEGQDEKFESLLIFESWARERFDAQEDRFKNLRSFEEWVRSQFDDCERNLTSKEELEGWINSKKEEWYTLLLEKLETSQKEIEDLKAAADSFMIHSNRSYSQSGEDAIMGYLLNFMQIDLANLTYLDLGANHAKEMSNTYYLYEKGVRGVIVEANPELIPELKALREGDTILNRVIVPEISSPQERFYLVNGDGISGFDYERVLAACRSNPELKITGDVLVTAITIDMLIEQYLQPDKLFVLSIDIEGIEETILRQIQWDAIRPVIVIVEAIEYQPYLVTGKAESGIEAFMKQKDYVEYAFTGINSIYVDRKYVQYINDKIIERLQQKN